MLWIYPNASDVCSDDLGAWTCTGSRTFRATVKITTTSCTLVSMKSAGSVEITVRLQFFVHGSDCDLHRMVAFLENTPGNMLYFIIMFYVFSP